MAYRLTSSTAAESRSDVSELPQLLQKRASGVLATEQTGQIVSSWLPHWEQNFEPGRFSCPHRGHCTAPCLLGMGDDNSEAGGTAQGHRHPGGRSHGGDALSQRPEHRHRHLRALLEDRLELVPTQYQGMDTIRTGPNI